jgi:hypothetical protein
MADEEPEDDGSEEHVDEYAHADFGAHLSAFDAALPDHGGFGEPGCEEAVGELFGGSGFVQRKVVSPNDFTELDQVTARLARFEARYNQTARPFKWKFTATDLAELLLRIDNHKPDNEPAQPRAA